MSVMKVSEIYPHPYNHKLYKDNEAEDTELMESIRSLGIQVPIVINSKNLILSGHRRHRCAERLGHETIPIVLKDFKDEDEEMIYLILSNQYRIKSNEEKIREGKKLSEILSRRGDGRVRDQVGKKIGMSGRTFVKGEAVVDEIDKLELKDPAAAAVLRKKLKKSVDSAHAALKDDESEEEEEEITMEEAKEEVDSMEKDYQKALKNAEKKRTFFYINELKEMLRSMDGAYKRLAGQRNSVTPTALGHMIGNIKDMHDRLSSWMPGGLVSCAECNGTGKITIDGEDGKPKEITCGYCINGMVGLHKESEH